MGPPRPDTPGMSYRLSTTLQDRTDALALEQDARERLPILTPAERDSVAAAAARMSAADFAAALVLMGER